jgi:Ca2+/Na+ antiporter
MGTRESSLNDSVPTPDPAEHAEAERQRRFDDADKYEKIMETAASIAVAALTTVFITWRFSVNFLGALVIGFLCGCLVYAIFGWEHEKRRNRRLNRS